MFFRDEVVPAIRVQVLNTDPNPANFAYHSNVCNVLQHIINERGRLAAE